MLSGAHELAKQEALPASAGAQERHDLLHDARVGQQLAVPEAFGGDQPGVPDLVLERLAVRERVDTVLPVVHAARTDPDPRVRAHAIATDRLVRDPDSRFESAIEEAKRVVALGVTGQEG